MQTASSTCWDATTFCVNKLHITPYFFKEPRMGSGTQSVSLNICWIIQQINLVFYLLFIDFFGGETKCHLLKDVVEELPNFLQLISQKKSDIYPL